MITAGNFLKEKFFCGTANTPALDFQWRLPRVSINISPVLSFYTDVHFSFSRVVDSFAL